MGKQRYAIIGAGALGGLYGAMLAKQGKEVHFLLHSDYDHVAANGLVVESVWGDFRLPKVHAHASPQTMPPCDITIVGLKTTQNHLLAELLPAPTRDGGVVLVLQNGLDVEQDTVAVVGEGRVFGGCCFLCSNKIGPGHIRHIDYGRIVFGQYGMTTEAMRRLGLKIAEDFNAAGVDTKFSESLPVVRWRKLMWNIPFNGLSVVLDASTKQIIENKHACRLANQIIREVHAGAAACGVAVPEEAIEITLEHTRKMVPYDSSMRLDFRNQRPMEVEAIIGNPVRAAARIGYEMCRVEMLYQQLKSIDAARSTSQQLHG
ncbi:putative 2-dehydropantoate 2-reductase [Novipirellula artificiosorum]|uniref:2-dehydropantoate 2-reductase n=1 Tax=Novipirellula artificiosorum TaxID=2528016 RepID=A0A5C6D6V1_9BACT|nr:putative 2-dehydropantoate 2-reductase [Novipirellula artificiosorum]TWU32923.1 2-dehydropantoate 2-reductase [Novipirellula artificiosorum]